MKKLLLATTLAIATAIGTLASTAHAQTSKTSQVQKVQVKDLSFKNVMRALYAGRMQHLSIDRDSLDDDLKLLPYVGLSDHAEHSIDEADVVAFMHPVAEYYNADHQKRYLIVIEKIFFDDELNQINCHACSAASDLYIFKPTSTGYELVSRTAQEGIFGGSWGRSSLVYEDIIEGLQPIGKHLTGAILHGGYCASGVCEFGWSVLHLSESNPINDYFLGDAGGTNEAYGWEEENHPLIYDYDSTPQIMKNGSAYFPIQLHFTGDMPINDDWNNIQEVDFIKEMRFDPAAKKYR